MIRRLMVFIIVIAVVGVAVNDLSRISKAVTHLRSVTYDVTRWAADNALQTPRDKAAAKILADAQAQGVTLYAYDQDDKSVRVYTSREVTGTIVAGPIYNLIEGASFNEAISSPFTIRNHKVAGIVR